MILKPINTEQEYDAMMDWIDKQFAQKTSPDSTNGKLLQQALLLIKDYEDERYRIDI